MMNNLGGYVLAYKYFTEHKLLHSDTIQDGFYDVGRALRGKLPSLDELKIQPVEMDRREGIEVNTALDYGLRSFVTSAIEICARKSPKAQIEVLSNLVAEHFGGNSGDIEVTCQKEINELKMSL